MQAIENFYELIRTNFRQTVFYFKTYLPICPKLGQS